MKNKNYFILAILFLLNVHILLGEEQNYNPADPTFTATSLQFMPEYNQADSYKTNGLRVNIDRDWGGGVYSVNVELAYGRIDYTEGMSNYGFTDIRSRFFYKFYDNSGGKLTNMVFNLDVFIPTGNAENGFGIGTFQIVPGVIFAFLKYMNL